MGGRGEKKGGKGKGKVGMGTDCTGGGGDCYSPLFLFLVLTHSALLCSACQRSLSLSLWLALSVSDSDFLALLRSLSRCVCVVR